LKKIQNSLSLRVYKQPKKTQRNFNIKWKWTEKRINQHWYYRYYKSIFM